MAINVNYAPNLALLGGVAHQTGMAQGQNQALMDALNLSQFAQRERFNNLNLAQNLWSTRFRTAANQQAQLRDIASRERMQGRSIRANALQQQQQQNARFQMQAIDNQNRQEMAMFQQKSQERMAQFNRLQRMESLAEEEASRNRLANQEFLRNKELSEFQDEQTRQMFEYRHTRAQRQKMEALQNQIMWVQSQNTFTPDQKAQAIQQLEAQFQGISQPLPVPKESFPWPDERAPGNVWEDRGHLWSMYQDNNGQWRVEDHGPVPALSNDRQIDREPFQQGMGVYQYDSDGKVQTLLPPPKLPDAKLYADTYSDVRESMMGALPKTVEGNVADYDPIEFEQKVQAATAAQIGFMQQQMMFNHQQMMNQMLGTPDMNGIPAANNPASQPTPFGAPNIPIDPELGIWNSINFPYQEGDIVPESDMNQSPYPAISSIDQYENLPNGAQFIDLRNRQLHTKDTGFMGFGQKWSDLPGADYKGFQNPNTALNQIDSRTEEMKEAIKKHAASIR